MVNSNNSGQQQDIESSSSKVLCWHDHRRYHHHHHYEERLVLGLLFRAGSITGSWSERSDSPSLQSSFITSSPMDKLVKGLDLIAPPDNIDF